jgi:hypothetical protein
MVVNIRPSVYADIAPIAANIREADRQEMYDYLLLSPTEALEKSYAISTLCWTGLIDGVPVCMFGASRASYLSDTGLVWMIGTKALDDHAMTFLRRCKHMVEVMRTVFPRLENYVAEYNEKSIAWLKWLGFKFDEEPQKMGLFKKNFYRFYMDT